MSEGATRTSDEFRSGRAEGVRAALDLIEAMLAAEEIKLDLPAPYTTRMARRTRWQAYRNASSRLSTLLTRLNRGAPVGAEIETKLKRLGF